MTKRVAGADGKLSKVIRLNAPHEDGRASLRQAEIARLPHDRNSIDLNRLGQVIPSSRLPGGRCARLYFDVEGLGPVPNGPRMRAKPTLVLLQGGPGFDRSLYKPVLSSLAGIARSCTSIIAEMAVASDRIARLGWPNGAMA